MSYNIFISFQGHLPMEGLYHLAVVNFIITMLRNIPQPGDCCYGSKDYS